MKKIDVLLYSCVFVLFSLVGCSNAKVDGTVKFKDGTPLTEGKILFEAPKVGSVSGMIKNDGSFQLGTLKDGDGVPRGSYRGKIIGTMKADPNSPKEDIQYIRVIDAKYENYETSGITLEVKGKMTVDIPVEAPSR